MFHTSLDLKKARLREIIQDFLEIQYVSNSLLFSLQSKRSRIKSHERMNRCSPVLFSRTREVIGVPSTNWRTSFTQKRGEKTYVRGASRGTSGRASLSVCRDGVMRGKAGLGGAGVLSRGWRCPGLPKSDGQTTSSLGGRDRWAGSKRRWSRWYSRKAERDNVTLSSGEHPTGIIEPSSKHKHLSKDKNFRCHPKV